MEIISLPFRWLSLLIFFFFTLIFGNKIKGSRSRTSRRSRKSLLLPPSPPTLPFIGNLHQLGKLSYQSLHQLSQKYGPVMLLRFGFTPVVVISSSEAAAEVLKTQDLESCTRPKLVGTKLLSHDFKDIGFTPYGEGWRQLRKVAVLELFSLKKVKSVRYIRDEENDLLVKKLSEFAKQESLVDLSKTLCWLTASIIFRVVFGQSFHECKFIGKDRIKELVFESQMILSSFTASDCFPSGVGWFIDWFSGQNKRLNDVFVELDTFFQHVIDDHLKPGRTTQDPSDIIDVMLNMIKEQDKDNPSGFTVDHIKGVLTNIFLWGIDTGAITMVWTMTELARNPTLMKKAQEEIRSCLGQKERITEDDLDHLTYLKLIVKETLRLHPSVPLLLPRETMNNIKIQGYDIPKKTRIQLNAWAIGRDPKYWTNPNEFNPERFIDSPIDYKGQHFELLPFGSGRRICPGISMAVVTVELALANLLYFFNWKLPDGMTENDIDMEEVATLTSVKKVPLELVPVRSI